MWDWLSDDADRCFVTMAYPIDLQGEGTKLFRAIRELIRVVPDHQRSTTTALMTFLGVVSEMDGAELEFMALFSRLMSEVERIKKTIPPIVHYGQSELRAMAELAASQKRHGDSPA